MELDEGSLTFNANPLEVEKNMNFSSVSPQ